MCDITTPTPTFFFWSVLVQFCYTTLRKKYWINGWFHLIRKYFPRDSLISICFLSPSLPASSATLGGIFPEVVREPQTAFSKVSGQEQRTYWRLWKFSTISWEPAPCTHLKCVGAGSGGCMRAGDPVRSTGRHLERPRVGRALVKWRTLSPLTGLWEFSTWKSLFSMV